MSKKDKIKEKIGILKFWLGIIVATLLAIAGWVVTNYAKAGFWLITMSFVATIILVFLAVVLSQKINNKIDKLEDL